MLGQWSEQTRPFVNFSYAGHILGSLLKMTNPFLIVNVNPPSICSTFFGNFYVVPEMSHRELRLEARYAHQRGFLQTSNCHSPHPGTPFLLIVITFVRYYSTLNGYGLDPSFWLSREPSSQMINIT